MSYTDPYIENIEIDGSILNSEERTDELLSLTSCVVIATDHSCYDYQHITNKASLVFDTRGATRGFRSPNIVRL